MTSNKSTLGATLMVAGLCIGGAMIGLPSVLVGLGLWCSLAMLVLSWGFMTYTALLTYEANTAYPPGCHFLTMASHTLGIPGKLVTSGCYLILLYALVTAYLTASSAMINDLFTIIEVDHLGVAMLLILGVVVGLVATGTTNVAKCNRLLMGVLVALFFAMVVMVLPQVDTIAPATSLLHDLPIAGVVVLTSFGFHILIPTLRVYTEGDKKRLLSAVFAGGALALMMYVLWVVIVLGAVPAETLLMVRDGDLGSAGIIDAMISQNVNGALQIVGSYFILLAVLTSFIGVLVSLVDFLSDSLQIKNMGVGRAKLLGLALMPPLFFVIFYPHGFVTALTYAGIMVAILHGALPALMVLKVRQKQLPTYYQAPGNHAVLYGVLIISIAIIVAECIEKWL